MFWSIAKVTENTIAGNVVILLTGNRTGMSADDMVSDADALAASIAKGARVIDTGHSVAGYPQRRYYANVENVTRR